MSLYELNDGFKQYLNQKFTPEERQKFINWLSSSENEEKVKQYLYDQLKDFSDTTELKDVDFDSIYSKINDKINLNEISAPEVNKSRELLNIAFKAAAIFLVVVISSYLVYNIVRPNLLKNASRIQYEIKAPLGAKTEITLPDGSKVWLNAGSKLKYNAGFNVNNRDLSLDGEAFFNVHKNKELPFIVKTSYIDIKAVGTSFNVKAYEDEGTIETTLVEGKLALYQKTRKSSGAGEFVLEPNQRATFIKEKTSFQVTDVRKLADELAPEIKIQRGKVYIIPKIDPQPIIAWKDNRMIIRGEEMESLIVKLERKYDVSILIEDEYVKKFRFSGTLNDETLQQVLDVIKLSAPIDYTIEGKTVIIKENEQSSKRFKKFLKNENM